MPTSTTTLTTAQERTLRRLCQQYSVDFHDTDYPPQFDLPTGWVGGWVGGAAQAGRTLFVGVDPDGSAHS